MTKQSVIDYFLAITQIATPSGKETALSKYIERKADEWGLEIITKAEESGCLVVKMPANKPGYTSIFFSSHLDTNAYGKVPIKSYESNGIIRARAGQHLGADDKAGVAAMLAAMEYLVTQQISHGDIEWVFSVEEEKGMLGSKRFPIHKIVSEVGYCLDGPGEVGGYQLEGEGLCLWTIKLKFSKSETAATLTQHFLRVLKSYPEEISWQVEQFFTDPTGKFTIQISIEKRNDMTDLISYLEEAVEALRQTRIGMINSEIETIYPGFQIVETAPVVAHLMNCSKKPMHKINFSGGSDANIWNANNKQVVLLSAGFAERHELDVRISTANLEALTELVCQIVTTPLK